ncbi:MAG: IS66 family transposase [Shackletoniella antarctica]|jgi:predicted RecB family nuclease|uniref:IS66 family transposase n=1 Tax=Shackletoniella antarctica TaxID=268115 RepID=A0A2W4WEP0_9CYAN|nr:MAG: IS66 family transposase [Shackletoniella antarctica]
MSDISIITSEIFVAYSQCPRKAFLLLFSEDKGKPHDYPLILEERRENNRSQYVEKFLQFHPEATTYDPKALNKYEMLVNATLRSEHLEADCAILTKADTSSANRRISYEPTIVTGTYSIPTEQRAELLFVGWVLGQIQKQVPVSGQIVGMDGKAHRVQLENGYKSIKPLLKVLQDWCSIPPTEPPALILNKHCSSCQFQQICREQAEKENNLSLLDRMTAKAIQKYNKRGIFTVQQLSYLFKPRRKRKMRKESEPIKHSLELQALAIREQKIYIQEMPELTRQPVELFLDIEGIPDQRFYYLMGLLICEKENCSYHHFWADTIDDEENAWNQLTKKIEKYPDSPIFHYGSYELKAVNELSKRYSGDCENIKDRLININPYIYGKIYFPVFSNSLKKLADFIGFSWTSSEASGLQSLVWRYRWEDNAESECGKRLIIYNQEDCEALKKLTDELCKIKTEAESQSNIEFADQQKRISTETSEEIHNQFETILKFAHFNYNDKKIRIRKDKAENIKKACKIKKKGYSKYKNILASKVNKVIFLPHEEKCPRCEDQILWTSKKIADSFKIDLVFTANGCKKYITKLTGFKGCCSKCGNYFSPPGIHKNGRDKIFGRGLQAWTIYQRLVLRLPYELIAQTMDELFNITIGVTTIIYFVKQFAIDYDDTEQILVQRILESPFIHADETLINIRGVNQYVWTFTDGKHVIFKLTKTREADIVHETLREYHGILVSDFYGGYDSVACTQQKCWVHLLRDINDDLWESPFDTEYEAFVLEIKKLILPIFEAVDKYGLKRRHLRKFGKGVDRFYKNNIQDKIYHSELAIKYQKRFERYREGLFTFLEHDSVPWHNNTAERALRHIAIQRKISGFFFESGATSYLTLLGITQTCRFQEKSFLKFLISGEKNVDAFKSPKIKKRTQVAKSIP